MLRLIVALAAAALALVAGAPAHAAEPDLAVIITNRTYEPHKMTHDVIFAHEDGKAFRRAALEVFKVPENRIVWEKDASFSRFRLLFGTTHARLGSIAGKLSNPKSRLYVYYSGHGMPSQNPDPSAARKPYLMPVEADPSFIHATGYALEDLIERLREIRRELLPEGQVILVLEACFSGVSSQGTIIPDINAGAFTVEAPKLTNRTDDIVIISASRENEVAFWDKRASHGVFTNAFLHGLYGLADLERYRGNADHQLSLGELKQFTADYMANRLPLLFGSNRPQSPVFLGPDNLVVVNYAVAPFNKQLPIRNEAQHDRERADCRVLSMSKSVSEIDEFLTKTCDICECREQLISRKREIERSERACVSERDAWRRFEGYPEQLETLLKGAICSNLERDLRPHIEDLKQVCAREKGELETIRKGGNFRQDLEVRLKRQRFRCGNVADEARETLARITSECRRVRETYPDIKSLGDPDALEQIAWRSRGCPEFAEDAKRLAQDLRQACETEHKQIQALIRRGEDARIREFVERSRCAEAKQRADLHLRNREAMCATDQLKWEKLKSSKDLVQIRAFREGMQCERIRQEVDLAVAAIVDADSPSPTKGTPVRECSVCPEVKLLPGGCFLMGGNPADKQTLSAERPLIAMRIGHLIAMGTREVTIGEWNHCFAEKRCALAPPAGVDANLPMTGVSWKDAMEYRLFLTVRMRKNYRLPTEAEWEYAARAGTRTAFSVGEVFTSKDGRYKGSGGIGPVRVASYKANAFGLFDMHGNVSELVADCYLENHRGRPTDGSAVRTCPRDLRVIRGGSWKRLDTSLRSAWRDYIEPEQRSDDVGFRIVRVLSPNEFIEKNLPVPQVPTCGTP